MKMTASYLKRLKPKTRVLSEKTKERLRQAQLKSWRSGTRRKRRTKKEVEADRKIFLDQEYRQALASQYERTRIANAARYEIEDAEARRKSIEETRRAEIEAQNEKLIAALRARGYKVAEPKIPAGVGRAGSPQLLDVQSILGDRPRRDWNFV